MKLKPSKQRRFFISNEPEYSDGLGHQKISFPHPQHNSNHLSLRQLNQT